ncbi:MAG: sporulation integral membrane protein YtvI [Oscillospiraceae bacterium]|nr:sporulation integral membrane protein YtvI [Oscillospiraceae bacterium]
MGAESVKKAGILLVGLALLWLSGRYLLPLALPFVLGGGIALAAEPGVAMLSHRMKWRRFPAVLLCVSLTLVLLTALIYLVGAAAVRELSHVARDLPRVEQTVEQGMEVLEDFLISAADRAPDAIRPMLIQTVMNTFADSTALLEQAANQLPSMAAGVIGKVSKGALTVGTGVLSGYMISARLPKIRSAISCKIPKGWREKALPAISRIKTTFFGWLQAQLKMMSVTWLVIAIGLTILKIPYGFLWAILVALVDAVPILGTGTILVPWAIISFLQGNGQLGGGLMAVYGIASLVRSVVEPRVVGKSLGLDPLLSLMAVYFGFRLLGFVGIVLAPVSAALIKSMFTSGLFENSQIIHKQTP